MLRHSVSAGILFFWVAGSAVIAAPAQAQTPLTRAVVSALRNRVRLLPKRRPARPAKISDVVTPGDGLSTARASLAELRFNDGTLARMGERAVFRFVPKTRRFRLSSGTVLLLIPPGQGRTQVRTPNVTAGIRGSALFVRYAADTNTTIVGALTDSGIEVTNDDGSQRQVLEAGQMVVTVGDRIEGLYDFDLEAFYETSSLVEGLELDNPKHDDDDEAIAQVREETLDGLRQQDALPRDDFASSSVLENPGFINLSTVASTEDTAFPGRSIGVNDVQDAEPPAFTTVPPNPPPAVVTPPPAVIPNPEPPVAVEPEPPATIDPEPPVAIDPEPPVDPVIDQPINDITTVAEGDNEAFEIPAGPGPGFPAVQPPMDLENFINAQEAPTPEADTNPIEELTLTEESTSMEEIAPVEEEVTAIEESTSMEEIAPVEEEVTAIEEVTPEVDPSLSSETSASTTGQPPEQEPRVPEITVVDDPGVAETPAAQEPTPADTDGPFIDLPPSP